MKGLLCEDLEAKHFRQREKRAKGPNQAETGEEVEACGPLKGVWF